MKYEVTKGCVIQGVSHSVGEVLELEPKLAEYLMDIGRVAPHDETVHTNRAIGAQGSEDKPKKRAPRKAKAK